MERDGGGAKDRRWERRIQTSTIIFQPICTKYLKLNPGVIFLKPDKLDEHVVLSSERKNNKITVTKTYDAIITKDKEVIIPSPSSSHYVVHRLLDHV